MDLGLTHRAVLVAALMASTVGPALIGAGTPAFAKDPCPEGTPRVADLGIRSLSCNCIRREIDGPSAWRFFDEPRIGVVASDGPGAGRLMPGDVVTAIDGSLITTRDGARRFGLLEPGRPVVLTVRREGTEREVRIVPGQACPGVLSVVVTPGTRIGFLSPVTPGRPATAPRAATAPRPASTPRPAEPAEPAVAPEHPLEEVETPEAVEAPEPPRPPRAVRAPRAPRAPAEFAPRARAQGWLGIGLSCNECGISADAPEGERVWEFRDQPEISYVDPDSPAARSGLRRGDVLTHIDGIALVSEEGGRAFGAVRPGQSVRLGYKRGEERGSLRVVAMARPDADMELARRMTELREQIRVLEQQRSTEDMARSMAGLRRLTSIDPEIWKAGKRSLRYSGAVGSSDVEVRGLGTVAVSKDERTGELIITTSDATIRVRPAEKNDRKKR
jgi:hypothetical protein